MPEPLAAQIREAVAAARYSQAAGLWKDYAAEVSAEVSAGSGARLPEMHELIEWTRVTVTCARAQARRSYSARLMEIHAAGAYDRGSH
jgi:hypothetical protein